MKSLLILFLTLSSQAAPNLVEKGSDDQMKLLNVGREIRLGFGGNAKERAPQGLSVISIINKDKDQIHFLAPLETEEFIDFESADFKKGKIESVTFDNDKSFYRGGPVYRCLKKLVLKKENGDTVSFDFEDREAQVHCL